MVRILAAADDGLRDSKTEEFDVTDVEPSLIEAVHVDDKAELLEHAKRLFGSGLECLDRRIASKLLRLCCSSDSAECAAALLSGELGAVLPVNQTDEAGWSALHTAANLHAKGCVEVLLRKHARTNLKTKDGRALLALELSLSSSRLEVIWNPDGDSIEDLLDLLTEKDLSTVKLLSEKTKEVPEVAYTNAVEGRIVPLAALLLVVPEKINESVLELRDGESGSKEKTTVYEGVIRGAMTLWRQTTASRAVQRTCSAPQGESARRRKLLLREIELLQLFRADASSSSPDRKATSHLIRACQAGDVNVTELLLRTSVDVNGSDAEGNTALHWSLKASPNQMKIVWLLLKHGARVSQKNKLGLTALHLAAASGNSQALQVFLIEDPDAVNSNTETMETPLFFAVKNDHIDCCELLLRWGANSEVFNLRQRPIDLAKSQDMRFMLNSTNISHISRVLPVQQKHITCFQDDDKIAENYDAFLFMTDEDTTTDSICSKTKTEICKYYRSPRGCVRGDVCFYAHGEKELRRVEQGTHVAKKLRRKIFVGGLPPTMDSDSLAEFFEEQFGPVEDAIVVGVEEEGEIKSRGFGFVTFKQEISVSRAVETRFVVIMGKQVEIKSVIPKSLPLTEFQKLSALPHHPKLNSQQELQAETPSEKIKEKFKGESMSWVGRLLGQPKKCLDAHQDHISPASAAAYNLGPLMPAAQSVLPSFDENQPAWLRIFKNWLPRHLKDQSTTLREGEYALSSLKGDFRATFGMELDHVSLGYYKLSDFMRSMPELCRMKVVPIGKFGPATHLVLLPNFPMSHQQAPHTVSLPWTPSGARSINESCDSVCLHGHQKVGFTDSSSEETKPAKEYPEVNSAQNDATPGEHLRFLQFLKRDPLFHDRLWLQNQSDEDAGDTHGETRGSVEGFKRRSLMHQQRHLVLEALARKRNSKSVFFLGDFDFYKDYKTSIVQGKCFACNRREMRWANFPCRHLLWCDDCKLQATRVAGASEHKCVMCHMKVQKIDLLPWHGSCQPARREKVPDIEEFPPFDPYHIQSPYKKKDFN